MSQVVSDFVIALGVHRIRPLGSALRSSPDPLQEFAGEVLHPRGKDLRCVPLRRTKSNELVVPNARAMSWFDSPSGNNVVLFDRAPVADVLMLETPGRPVWYERQAISSPLPATEVSLGDLSRRIYRQVRQQPVKTASVMSVVTSTEESTPNAWLNPVLVKYNVGDSALGNSAGVDRTVIDQSDVLAVQPRFAIEHELRILAWKCLAERLRLNPAAPSLMERLFLGFERSEAGRMAFHSLDALGGIFRIEHESGNVRFCWEPELPLAGNGAWYAEYHGRRWGGELKPAEGALCALDAEPAVDGGAPSLGDPVWLQATELAAATQSISGVLAQRPWSQMDPSHPIRFAAEVLEQARRRVRHADRCPSICYEIGLPTRFDDPKAPTPFRLRPSRFLDWFSTTYVLPNSQVLLGLPREATFDGNRMSAVRRATDEYELKYRHRFLDLRESIPWSGLEILQRLLVANRPERCGPSTRDIVYQPGWLWDFVDLYFRHREPTLPLRFILPRHGFLLGHSRLGKASLGTQD